MSLILPFILVVVFLVYPLIKTIVAPERLKEEASKQIRSRLEAQHGPFQTDLRINRIGTRLSLASGIKANWYRMDGSLLNALALPNGDIVVFKRVLNLVGNSDDQLASVLAHELGHLKHEHHIRVIQQQAGIHLLMLLALGYFMRRFAGRLGVESVNVIRRHLGGLGLSIVNKGFSRSRERQADDAGWDIMAQAGYRQEAMIELFDRLELVLDKLENKGDSPGFLGTHPQLQTRSARLRQRKEREPLDRAKFDPNDGTDAPRVEPALSDIEKARRVFNGKVRIETGPLEKRAGRIALWVLLAVTVVALLILVPTLIVALK